MTSLLYRFSLGLLGLQIFVMGIQGQSEDAPSKVSLTTLEEKETDLPCPYELNGEKVVQVTWYKIGLDENKEQMIAVHMTDGQYTSEKWQGRVHFKSNQPIADSALVITSTKPSDEGDYLCQITLFPSGSIDKEMHLTVWTIPISSLDPVVVKEGDSYKVVASCRSVAVPLPELSWDTELNGKASKLISDKGVVSIHFSLHPLRSMNGKKLDCLVQHPEYGSPRKIENRLVVHFPPNAEVSGYSEQWSVGMENAALTCKHEGSPEPTRTWTRLGGQLPSGAVSHPDGRLVFERPLNTNDSGTYQCLVNNSEGVDKDTVTITLGACCVPDKWMIFIIVGGTAAGLLVLMLVTFFVLACHHQRKNKKLKKELTQKKEQISTLSRQASFRRVNSVSTDAREVLLELEEHHPLKVEGTLRNSLSSLGVSLQVNEQARCRDSRSTVSGGRGGGAPAYDSLGRPSIYSNSRRGRDRPMDRDSETRLRIEQYVRNSNMSLQDPRLLPPLLQPTYPVVRSTEIVRQMNGNAVIPTEGGSHSGSAIRNYQPPPISCTYPQVTYDEDEIDEGLGGPASQEHPDDQDSVASSSNFSKNRMSPQPHNHNPHTSYVHKAQIV
ncbi:nectin-4-like isoform X1 [Poecilia reticulata]|uniref:nectin-4-like isoform X1 n=1 Tax=Poecilia reticulata TaxID=8081 RepID=UPI0004A28F45|nr:PREDICTED: nectin-4-like isoform X1 [Poecilia reticulata]